MFFLELWAWWAINRSQSAFGGDCAKFLDFMLGNCTRSCYNRRKGRAVDSQTIFKESKWFLAQGVCNHFSD